MNRQQKNSGVVRALATTGIFIAAVLVVPSFFRLQVGDIRPILLPASKEKNADDVNQTSLVIAPGFSISVFAEDVPGARDIAITPENDILVSQPSENQLLLLSDTDSDGKADRRLPILGFNDRPHGLSFFGDKLFIANERSVQRDAWNHGLPAKEKVLFSLPKGGRHTSRTIAFDDAGKMYISIGSTCNVCQEKDERLAAVMVSDTEGNDPRVLATGLRNAVFLEFEPGTQTLWGTEMGRDLLGDTTPPDEINIIESGHYGWPHCYANGTKDEKSGLSSTKNFDCSTTRFPAFQIPAHSAPLGLAIVNSPAFPPDWQGDLLVAYHGSWNSSTPVGYKVVRLHKNGATIESSEDFITNFLQGNSVVARPVDLEFDHNGVLYLSDDKSGRIFRIEKTKLIAH